MRINSLQTDFVKLYNECNDLVRLHQEDKKISLKATNKVSLSVLQYHTKFLAAVPMDKVWHFSSNKPEDNATVVASDGSRIDAVQLAALIRLQSRHSVSNWVNYRSSDPDYPTFSAAVPLVLMSHKKHHNTPYEAWKNVEGLEYILNPYLREALLVKKEGKWELDSNLPIFNPHILLQIRPDCLIWGGKPGSVTSWNIRKSGSDARFDAVRHQVRRMYLQTWMFSAEKRNKYMIADPFNWDTLPELLEDAVQHCEEPEQKPLDTDINWEEDWI